MQRHLDHDGPAPRLVAETRFDGRDDGLHPAYERVGLDAELHDVQLGQKRDRDLDLLRLIGQGAGLLGDAGLFGDAGRGLGFIGSSAAPAESHENAAKARTSRRAEERNMHRSPTWVRRPILTAARRRPAPSPARAMNPPRPILCPAARPLNGQVSETGGRGEPLAHGLGGRRLDHVLFFHRPIVTPMGSEVPNE